MITETKDKQNKEIRRATRTKKWLKDNTLPLSTKELKSLHNKEYQQRLKRKKEEEKDPNFNQNYKTEILNFISKQHYTHAGSLTYNYNASMFGAYRDSVRVFETLKDRGVIHNYFFLVEYADQQVHTHFIINTDYPTKINSKIYSVFNGIYEKGFVFVEEFKTESHLKNALKYFTDKLNVNNRSKQSQLDYWCIGLQLQPKKQGKSRGKSLK